MQNKTRTSLSFSNSYKVKAKVIKMRMSMYAMHVYLHAQFECHSLKLNNKKISQVLLLDAVIEKLLIYTLKTMLITLIEIEPISPTSFVGRAISGMGTYCNIMV